MFSSRLPSDLRKNRIADAIGAYRGELLDLTESNPTRAGFEYPAARILSGFGDERALVYDPESAGLESARELVATHHRVSLDRVMLTTSTSEAYAWLFKLLCDPGDQVLIPRPSYPLFEMLARLESIETRTYPLRHHHGWFVDFDALRAAITERTRAVVVVNPNNPTGSYLKRDELRQMVEICREHDLALISDEVFADYALVPDEGRVSTLTGVRDVLSFSLSGLSKLIGMPQMKLGWMVVSGPAALRASAMSRLEMIADTYLSVGTPVQYALPNLLGVRGEIQSQIMKRLESNLTLLRGGLDSHCTLLEPEGGWYATVRVPHVRSEEQWVLELISRGVLAQPGYFYDFDSEAYLVLSLLTRAEVFERGVRRLSDCVAQTCGAHAIQPPPRTKSSA